MIRRSLIFSDRDQTGFPRRMNIGEANNSTLSKTLRSAFQVVRDEDTAKREFDMLLAKLN